MTLVALRILGEQKRGAYNQRSINIAGIAVPLFTVQLLSSSNRKQLQGGPVIFPRSQRFYLAGSFSHFPGCISK